MRKDQAIYFVAGLIFGILLGYFVFESVVERPGVAAGTSPRTSPLTSPQTSPMTGSTGSGIFGDASDSGQAPARRLLDREEVDALERMLEQRPDDNELRIRIGNMFLEAGHDGEAVPYFEAALAREPNSTHARNHLALSFASLGRDEEAIAQYQEALRLEPGNPQGLVGLGRVRLYGQQDIRGGLEAWEELLRVAPNSPEADSIREELEALQSAHSSN